MVKEVIYCSRAAGEKGRILFLYWALCCPLWHSHIAAWKWQEKQPSRCYFCLRRFLPPVSVFLFPLHWCHTVQKCHLWRGEWHLTVLSAHVGLCDCVFVSGSSVTVLRKKKISSEFQEQIFWTFGAKSFQDLFFGKWSVLDNGHSKSAVIHASLSAEKH